MPKLRQKALTDTEVKQAKPALHRRELSDGGSCLALSIQPTGSKSWIVRYRARGERVKRWLGTYPTMGLAEARDQARRQRDADKTGKLIETAVRMAATPVASLPLLGAVASDAQIAAALAVLTRFRPELILAPAEAPPTVPADLPARPVNTVGACWADYVAKHIDINLKPDTAKKWKAFADKHVLHIWRNRDVQSITQQGDVKLVVNAAETRGIHARNFAITVLSAFFTWCAVADQGYIDVDAIPAKGFPKSDTASRKRYLKEAEIKTFWQGCTAYAKAGEFGRVFGPYCKLLLLTGARRNEVAGMRFDEIDFDERVWTIPGERTSEGRKGTKNDLPLAVYLTDQMLAVLKSVPKIKGSPFVFTTDGKSPISGFSKGKKELDALTPLPSWTLHDLRRTFISGCNSLRVIKGEVVEKCVNHISGKMAGVAGIYNVFEYWPEKKEAWELWSNHVVRLVEKRRDV